MSMGFPGLPKLSNRVGMAAGDDLWSHRSADFGFLEVGTVRPFRLPSVVDSLKKYRRGAGRPPVVGINIGCSLETDWSAAVSEYHHLTANLCSLDDYLVINLSAPVATLVGASAAGFRCLVDGLRQAHPDCLLFVNINGDDSRISTAAVPKTGLAGGIIVYPRTWQRPGEVARRTRRLRLQMKGGLLIVVGGIRTAMDARLRLQTGADMVQIYRAYSNGGRPAAVQLIESLASQGCS